MRFEQALASNPIPRQVGDVWLRYEPGLLVGESVRRRGWGPALLRVGALGAALVALVGLLQGTDGALARAAGAVAVAGLALGAALAWERRAARRRFVLHFGLEALRVEVLPLGGGRARRVQVPFDAVEAVEVHEGPAGFQLRVRYRHTPEEAPEEALLVAGVGAGEVDALRRLWRTLHHAFGLRGPPLAGAWEA